MKILLSPESAVASPGAGTTTTPPPAAPIADKSATATALAADAPGPDSFDSLDAMVTSKKAPVKPDTKPGDKPAADPKAEPAPDKGKDKEQRTLEPKALRQAYEKTTAEVKAHKETIASLEKRISEADAKGKDTTKLAERLASVEKDLAEARGQLRAAKQELSPEFIDRYEKPFQRAATAGAKMISQLQVGRVVEKIIPGEAGDPDKKVSEWVPERKADWEKDFGSIYGLPYTDAKARAKALFGEESQLVMDQYIQLHRLNDEKAEALTEEKASWQKKQEEESAREASQRQAFEAMYVKVNGDIANKRPEWFKDIPGDDEGNQLFKQGLALVDAQPNTLEDRVVKDAHVRLRAAAFTRLVHQLGKKDERIAELEEKLKAGKESEPGDTKRTTGAETAPEKSWKEDPDLKASFA